MTNWTLRVARQAEVDIVDILAWTSEQFGERQARIYAETLSLALEFLQDGPDVPGAKQREDIAPDIHVLHIARSGRKGRHFLVFRVAGDSLMDVLRVLHDSMDIPRHLGQRNR
ncbi:type II toxin-antitoxin system RelE/ParE family toxin [Acidithiobacillus ferrooxidans]|uniref:type II toxin-antitoxin system RelE/ParE family toxin n=1 Tax=Acidithiobacillus ferrooxidans TaxID=920 RepID=UPI0021487D48|nr:type II toxin-antitoxin system RelE/ParE family toxin [Acidithiobacillus ferrooxidans]MCR1347005.1 type II toxin-antitoxin system RelE/ParE family toxin [Acidithiobacillus ferrooxidans]MCR1353998.1 type II toxin-antitoxin system RelE/ParE family toxin [Acidithiobacillus ferrooxidans]